MTTLQSYKGLEVLPTSPTPAVGGEAISSDFALPRRNLIHWRSVI